MTNSLQTTLPPQANYRVALLAGVAVLPATLLLLPDVAEVLYTLLCTAGLALLILNGWHHPESRRILWPTLLTLAFFAAAALSIVASGDYSGWFRPLKKLSELLATPLLALLLVHAGANARFMLLCVKLTTLLLFAASLWEFITGVARPAGAVNAQVFGHIALLFGFVSLILYPRERGGERLLSLAAFAAGLMTAVLSQSRITLIIAVFLCANTIFLWFRAGLLSRRNLLHIAALFLLLAPLMANLPMVHDRIGQAVRNYELFRHQGVWDNSVGQRLLMWQSGLKAAARKPLLGWGMHRTQQAAASELTNPAVIEQVLEHHNLHSEYVNTLAGRGLVGLLSLLALLWIPWAICVKHARNPRLLAWTGTGSLLSVGYAVSGLTFQAFGDDAMNIVYALLLSFSLTGLAGRTTGRAGMTTPETAGQNT